MKNLNAISQQIPDLEILAKQVVDGFIIGLHKSPFHGFSVEFAEHRLYNAGDNLKHVDWKIFGKTEKMFSKKYEEETNLRCCIAIDTSTSMLFESDNNVSKLEASIQAAACLIELLRRQMDASALGFFNEQLYLLTKTGTSSAHKNVLYAQLEQLRKEKPTEATQTNISNALHELAERLHKRSLVLLFSDMMEDDEQGEELIAAIQHLRHNKHEVIVFMVGDKSLEWEFDFPNKPVELRDMERNEIIRLQPDAVMETYQNAMNAYIKSLSDQCGRMQVDFHLFDINDSPMDMLRIYLMKRMKMM